MGQPQHPSLAELQSEMQQLREAGSAYGMVYWMPAQPMGGQFCLTGRLHGLQESLQKASSAYIKPVWPTGWLYRMLARPTGFLLGLQEAICNAGSSAGLTLPGTRKDACLYPPHK